MGVEGKQGVQGKLGLGGNFGMQGKEGVQATVALQVSFANSTHERLTGATRRSHKRATWRGTCSKSILRVMRR